MKKVLSILLSPWVIGTLGFLALAFVIWFFGPMLSFNQTSFLEPESRRWGLIGFSALIIGGRLAWKKFRASRAEKTIVEGIVEAEDEQEPDRGAEEVETLKTRFEEATQLLKKSGGRRASLYDMPWYIIIGPPGSGKTTALINSGLEFPLADQFGKGALEGVGGTRNCDWWFTNEAVLLDTAGRYTTQESDASVDATAWQGFLDLLKRHRKRRPINGVFVTISIQDVLTLNERERAAHASAIKSRINELYAHFGIRVPVYMILTKADLMGGFMEFFDDLGQAQREQVWGFTLPLADKDTNVDVDTAFSQHFDALTLRLTERVSARLTQEQDMQRRARIFSFPQQVAAIKEPVADLIGKIFKPSRFDEAFLWRGLYMTSGTQEGTPIDRLVGSVARSFGLQQSALPSHSGRGRSYFIGDMMRKVAFAESELAGSNRRLERQRAWLQRGSYTAVALIAIASACGWIVSYFANRALVEDVKVATATLQEAGGQLTERLNHPLDAVPLLNAAESLPTGYGEQVDGVPLLRRLGLSQSSRLGRAAEGAYVRLLAHSLLPRVMLDQETQMRRGWDSDEMLFGVLKAYLMLDDDEHYDPFYVSAVWKLTWQDDLPRDTTQEEFDDLMRHASALTLNMPNSLPEALDDELIALAQRDAADITPAQRVYSRVRQEAEARNIEELGLPEFSIANVAGSDAAVVFKYDSGAPLSQGVPALFTFEGYHKLFTPINEEESRDLDSDSWVLGDEAEESLASAEIEQQVLELYLSDYADFYTELLADLSVLPPTDRSDAVTKLRILSHEQNSPLRRLVNGVLAEITLERDEDSSLVDKVRTLGDRAREAEQSLQRRLNGARATPRLPTASLTPRQRALARMGEKNLGGLRALTEGGETSPFEEVMALLGDLYVVMDDIDQSSDPVAASAQKGGEIEAISAELNRKTQGKDPMVSSAVTGIISGVKRVQAGDTRRSLNELWRSDGLEECRDTIANRYPFSPRASSEIELDDFGTFFGKGGVMDVFFEDHLRRFVNTSRSPWSWKSEMSGASTSALAQFERARRIRRAYFRSAGSSPQIRFALEPVTMDSSITRLTLLIGDSKISYDHGPTRPVQFTWPDANSSEVHIELAPQSPTPSADDEEGDWGWFRLLQRSSMRSDADGAGSYEVTFTIGSRRATFELDPKSSYNPFDLTDLTRFSCPERL